MTYLLGLNFALIAGHEHQSLRRLNSQFSLNVNESGVEFLRYKQQHSKKSTGLIKRSKKNPKSG